MKTHEPLAALAIAVAAGGAGGAVSLSTARATPPAAHAARTTTVTLKDISFRKATAKIAKGGSVTWVWKDKPTPHNVTFARKHSPTKQTGTYAMTFAKTGTFRYHCTLHPGMDGKVVVR